MDRKDIKIKGTSKRAALLDPPPSSYTRLLYLKKNNKYAGIWLGVIIKSSVIFGHNKPRRKTRGQSNNCFVFSPVCFRLLL